MEVGRFGWLVPSDILEIHQNQEKLGIPQISDLEKHLDENRRHILPVSVSKDLFNLPTATYGIGWLLVYLNWKVYFVDGEIIRRKIYIDFTSGGNFCRYRFVPPYELWIDRCLPDGDKYPTLLHECIETLGMMCGESYNSAHDTASQMEIIFRKNPNSFFRNFWPKIIKEITGIAIST